VSDPNVTDAEAALSQGRLTEAERSASQALARDSRDVRASVVLAMVEARTGRQSQALDRFKQVLVDEPRHFEATFWLSVLCRQRGDLPSSIDFAKRAVSLKPTEAHVYSNLGLSQLARHDLVNATANFQRAAELNPKLAPNFHYLGLVFQLQGKDDEAIQAFRRALKLAPTSVDTLLILGQSLMNRLDTAAAGECAQQALKLKPNSATAHLLLANALIAENRTDEAEEHMNQVVALDPKEGTVHAMLGMRLQGLGRLDEANASFRKSIELQPEQGFAYCALTRNHKVSDADSDLIAGMERILESPSLPLRGKSFLHFGLGKAYEDLKQYERAMRHFDQANAIAYRLRFGSGKFDRRQYVESIDWTIKAFPEGTPRPWTSGGSGSDKPIFIVGMMRSGTTLVEQILSSHPRVEARGEQQFWMKRGSEAFAAQTGKLDGSKVHRLAAAYLEDLSKPYPEASHLTDKMPDNYLALGLIHAAFPEARIIHTRRNPIDTCISIYTTPNRTSDPYANDRENIVFAYEQYLRLMAHWRKVLPADRLLEVDYESLVANPEPITRAMIDFCGLEWDEACLHPEDNERAVATPSVWQVRQPVYGTSVERWRKYEPWLGPFARLRGAADLNN
jgi:tetratricopeptide (TPR) repeat protein